MNLNTADAIFEQTLVKLRKIRHRRDMVLQLKELIVRQRATAKELLEKLAACKDEVERLCIEEELLYRQEQFLHEQVVIVRAAEAAGVWGEFSQAAFYELPAAVAMDARAVPAVESPAQLPVAVAAAVPVLEQSPVAAADAVAVLELPAEPSVVLPDALPVPELPAQSPVVVDAPSACESPVQPRVKRIRRLARLPAQKPASPTLPGVASILSRKPAKSSAKAAPTAPPKGKKVVAETPRRTSTRPKRKPAPKRRFADSDDEDAETLGDEDDDQTGEGERQDVASESFVVSDANDGTDSSDEWDGDDPSKSAVSDESKESLSADGSSESLLAEKPEQEDGEEKAAQSDANQDESRPKRARIQNANINLCDAQSSAFAGNCAPLEAYYSGVVRSSLAHCGAPLDANRMAEHEAMAIAAMNETLSCVAIKPGPYSSGLYGNVFETCCMCNTRKPCSYEVQIFGRAVIYAGAACAMRLQLMIEAGSVVARIRSNPAAFHGKQGRERVLRMANYVDVARAALLK